MVNAYGLTDQNIKENGKIILLMDQDDIFGVMVANIMECGKTVTFMDMVYFLCQKEINLKDSSQKIKNKAMVHLCGRMVAAFQGGGMMENSMD